MAIVVKKEVNYNHTFDPQTKRHEINGLQSVFHCHHFTVLYSQLAIDAGETDLLKETARNSFYKVLTSYFTNNSDIVSISEKVDIACQYFALVGLGKMEIVFLGDFSGEVKLLSSHVDNGWIKKWGTYDKPVNYISAGMIEAIFASVLDLPVNSFNAIETTSIVMGADSSLFKVTRG